MPAQKALRPGHNDPIHRHSVTRGGASARTGQSPLTKTLLGTLLLSVLTLPGCGFVGFPGVYRIDIEQGNLVDQEMIEQLQPNMSRRQVRFIMGSPLVEDTFNPDRWDYPYVIRNGTNIIREAQVTIIFEDDRLTEIRGDYLPEWARSDTEADAEATPEEESGDESGL